jgi:hypothetical protein
MGVLLRPGSIEVLLLDLRLLSFGLGILEVFLVLLLLFFLGLLAIFVLLSVLLWSWRILSLQWWRIYFGFQV